MHMPEIRVVGPGMSCKHLADEVIFVYRTGWGANQATEAEVVGLVTVLQEALAELS